MANRAFYPSQNYGSSRVYAEFRFTMPGSGTSVAATAVSGANIVASIAHVAASNTITVTLADTFNKVIYADASIIGTNGAYAQVGTISNEGTATPISFVITTFSAAGAALNDATGDVCVCLAFRNGSWGVQ